MKFSYKLGIIGYGNMASAISEGAISSEYLKARKIIVYDRNLEKREKASSLGIKIASSVSEVAYSCEYLLFAVKPQSFAEVAEEVKMGGYSGKMISILAGTTIEKFRSAFGDISIVRVMPNTPCTVGCGMSAIATDGTDDELTAFTTGLFDCFGETVHCDEGMINSVIAVSGSGPAYVYEFMNAMYKKALKLGFDEKDAKLLVGNTVLGGAELYLDGDLSLDELCAKVCSKGGTTIEAVKIFKENDLEGLVDKAMSACFFRAEELSK